MINRFEELKYCEIEKVLSKNIKLILFKLQFLFYRANLSKLNFENAKFSFLNSCNNLRAFSSSFLSNQESIQTTLYFYSRLICFLSIIFLNLYYYFSIIDASHWFRNRLKTDKIVIKTSTRLNWVFYLLIFDAMLIFSEKLTSFLMYKLWFKIKNELFMKYETIFFYK